MSFKSPRGQWVNTNGQRKTLSFTIHFISQPWYDTGCWNPSSILTICRAECRSAPSQWEMALLCNEVSHWLGASLESALDLSIPHRENTQCGYLDSTFMPRCTICPHLQAHWGAIMHQWTPPKHQLHFCATLLIVTGPRNSIQRLNRWVMCWKSHF